MLLSCIGEGIESEDLGLATNFQLMLFHHEALYFSCTK